jgi:hypothetical protein
MSTRADFSVDDAVFLLKRNWFLDVEGLFDFLWSLSDDVYDEVCRRNNEFHPDIQYWLTPNNLLPGVSEYTQQEWEEDQLLIEQKRQDEIKEFKRNYVPPPRPHSEIDKTYHSVMCDLEATEKLLNEAIARASRKRGYVPPNKRTDNMYDTDPAVQQIRQKIIHIKNRLETLNKILEQEDTIWKEQSVHDALIQNARRLSAR